MTSNKKSRRTGARAAREHKMRRLVRDQERSGLSQRKFCDEHGMPLSTLTWWRKELGQCGGRTTVQGNRHQAEEFLEVQLVDDTSAAGPHSPIASPIEICLPAGAVIRIPPEAPEATLRHVLNAVGAQC